MSILLDISRLLSRAGQAAPTGIDRVELAYAAFLLRESPSETAFTAVHPVGRSGVLPQALAGEFIHTLSAHWNRAGEVHKNAVQLARQKLHRHVLLGTDWTRPRRGLYLLLSHQNLHRPAIIARNIARRARTFVPMVHDLIPSQFPEYARPKEAEKHRRRMQTVTRFADAVLVPSHAVGEAMTSLLLEAGRGHVPVHVAPHGVLMQADVPSVTGDKPYFVCLGTIEPRKNHILLLNIWRRLVEQRGAAAPDLVLIGRRGWENENVIDMIERCPALQDKVIEYNELPDEQVVALLRGARALLFPSFAEGYGLPLAEALALGVPALCSDIPVFREIGGNAAAYLDPLDGLGWLRAVEKLCLQAPAPQTAWSPTGWDEAIRGALTMVEGLTA